MFAYLINLGFTEKQIVDYVRSTDYSLDQLLSDVNVQIDTAIKRLILYTMYECKCQLPPFIETEACKSLS